MPKPKLGLSMLYMLSAPFKKMTSQLGKMDTRYVEIVDDGWHSLTSQRVRILNELAKSYGLKYSVHAPFADINIASPSKTMLKASMKRLRKSMQFASDLDAYFWIVHPGGKSGISAFYPGADWKQNAESIEDLHKTAKNLGIKIVMENLPEKYNFLMKTPDDFNRFYDETGLADIGIVLDTGHAHLEGQIQSFLEKLPNKIVHVHVSDNHGIFDEHMGMGYGTIDWSQFVRMIKAANFSGTILAESVFNVEETVDKLKQLFA